MSTRKAAPTRHLLLAVTGMSPQVITETLYALHRDGEPWPQHIRVITTTKGKQKVWQALHHDGHLQALADQLQQPVPIFNPRDIRVIPGADGKEVDDARSLADHEALADFITDEVQRLTTDANLAIHASIAGGRKTMTFYLGYAMSLFGRVQDRLSHVLVSADYENREDFYYPTLTSSQLKPRPTDTHELDARLAEVTLADIPFVRQRALLPTFLKKNLGSAVRYRDLTTLINLADSPEQVHLTIHPHEQTLTIRQRTPSPAKPLEIRIHIVNQLHWAFYLMMVEATLNHDNDYNRPATAADSDLMGMLILHRLYERLGIPVPSGQRSRELASELLDNDHYLKYLGKHTLPVSALESLRKHNGLTSSQFDNYCTRIRAQLSEQLPGSLANALTPGPVQPLIDANQPEPPRTGKRSKNAGYGLNLPEPEAQIQYEALTPSD